MGFEIVCIGGAEILRPRDPCPHSNPRLLTFDIVDAMSRRRIYQLCSRIMSEGNEAWASLRVLRICRESSEVIEFARHGWREL
jgi:hypothetical protein